MNVRDFALLLLLGALFGAAFLFIRIAAPAFGPVPLMTARVLLAAAVLYGYGRLLGHPFRSSRPLWSWLLLGALNAAAPFTLIAWAELHITSSLAAMAMATLPLFTALVAALWLRERLTRAKLAGMGLGLAGVVVLSGWSPQALSGIALVAVAATLVAALLYAVGGIYTKHYFRGVPRVALTSGNFAAAGLVLLPLNAVVAPPGVPPAPAFGALAALVVAATVVPFLLYFRLLDRSAATTASSVAFLIPAFGTLWGVLFLGETVNLAMLLGFVVVLAGVALVTGATVPLPRRRLLRGRRAT